MAYGTEPLFWGLTSVVKFFDAIFEAVGPCVSVLLRFGIEDGGNESDRLVGGNSCGVVLRLKASL